MDLRTSTEIIVLVALVVLFGFYSAWLLSQYHNRVRAIKSYLMSLRKTQSVKETMHLFVHEMIRKLDVGDSAVALFIEKNTLVSKIGYNIPEGSLSEIHLHKVFLSYIESKTQHDVINPSYVRLLSPYFNLVKSIYFVPFRYRDTYCVVLFLSHSNSFTKSHSVLVDICADQTLNRIMQLSLESETERMSHEIGSLEKSFVRVLDYSPSGIVLLQPDLKILYVNQALLNTFSFSRKKEIVGKSFFHLFDLNYDVSQIDQVIGSLLSGEIKVGYIPEFKCLTHDHEVRHLDAFAYAVASSEMRVYQIVVVVRDRTKQFQLQQELRLTQEMATKDLHRRVDIATKELQDANMELKRLNSLKSEFISAISHELRTPLTSILGYISLLANGKLGPLSSKQQASLTILNEESHRLANLINEILDFSRLESGKTVLDFKKIDVEKLLEKVITILQPQLRAKKLTVDIKVKTKIRPLCADEGKIIQVFMNLIGNAIKFSPSGQKILVTLAHNKYSFVATVTDYGIGMKTDQLEKIFDSFYMIEETSHKQNKGTGLGLAIVKHIIDLHKGKIEVDSVEGKGSVFTLTIPTNLC